MIFKIKTPFVFLAAVFRAIWHSLTSPYEIVVTESQQNKRLSICRSCKYHDDGQCEICTCYIEPKSMLVTEDCPIGRWPKL